MTSPLVRLQDLHVKLGGVPILRGVTADIPRGRITALIGLNGSGKTTLLRTLLKEVPAPGRVEFKCGHDHTAHEPQHVGYVPQRLMFDPNLPITVCELMTLAIDRRPLFFGISSKTRLRIKAMLEQVQAGGLMDASVGTLSGGELQRILLALALEPHPELLLLDEPAAGIDFKYEGEFYGLIHRLNHERGVTIVLVTHDLSIVPKCADEVLCLNAGRIVCHGPPQDVSALVAEAFGKDKSFYAHHDH